MYLQHASLSTAEKQAATPFDDSIRDARERAYRQARLFEVERERDYQDAAWWAKHAAVLASSSWRAKKEIVLRRDLGRCRGCASAPASEIHHLTYAHLGEELLFELVALCRSCHEHAHNSDLRYLPG